MPETYFSFPFVKGKARPRFSNGRAYSPKPTKIAEMAIRNMYRDACIEQHGRLITAPADVPVYVYIATFRSVNAGFRKRDGDSHPDVQKPDADNVAKLVLDALNGIAYEDDAQVNDMHVTKAMRHRGMAQSTFVYITWKEPNE